MAAGAEFSITPYGARALMSLRLEKNWGVWTLDYRPDFNAIESGMDIFIDWSKDFIGKEATLKYRNADAIKKLVTMTIENNDIDVSNDEAIIVDNRAIGYVTSGGYAYHIGKSMAMGYIESSYTDGHKPIHIEINGTLYQAQICPQALYDPAGYKMRS